MSVESSSRELFHLINLASFDKGHSVQSAAFTESRNFIYGLLISSNKKLNFCHIPKHRKEDKLKGENLLPSHKSTFDNKALSESFKLQQLEWFSHESMRAKAASFNPLGDYCLVVTESMDLFVICVERIISGTEVMGKASSGLSWHKEVVSQVYRAAPSSDSGDGVTSVLGAPSCVLWWETSDFIQLGIVGTDTGNLVVINLVSGTMLSHCLVKGSVSRLEMMLDSALDCVNLLVTTESQQWRVLVEQRSTGYVWGCAGDLATCHVPPSPQPTRVNGHSNEGDDTGAVQRTRLQSIKQMSVDRITNLRNRLAEGRKMLKSRSECEENFGGQARVECVTQDTASSLLSVQTDTSGHRYFVAGLALDTSLMTIHDTDVDNLSERAASAFYKLPPASSRLIINGKLIISSSHSYSPELSSQISVSSAVMSESKPQSQSFKQESVLQSFTLQPGEQILHFSSVEIFKSVNLNSESSKKLENGAANQISKSPFRRLVCVTTNDKGEKEKTIVERNKSSTPSSDSSSNKSECGLFGGSDLGTKDISQQLSSSHKSVFEQKTVNSLDAIKTKYSAMMGAHSGYIIVTDRNVYLMRMTQDPIDMFLSCVMQSRMRESEVMARCFGLEKAALVELAGDIRLYQGDIASAVSLYRQAGTKHVKTALKLAASGNVAELLSFLQAVFSSQNIEISAGDRVHLSNLSLMCQFHQLCSSSLLSKYYFEEKLFFFLKSNRWYDSGLAVRQCVEAGAWKLVTGLTQHLGLEAEVGAGLVLYNIGEIVKSGSQETRQEIISLLLLPHLLPSLLDSPGAGQTLAGLLNTFSNDLSGSQLNTLLHNTCPARRDLQPLFVISGRSEDQGDELRMFRRKVIELFLSLCLILVKRKQDNGSQNLFDKSLVRIQTASDSDNNSDDDDSQMSDVQLSCGYNHSLYKCPSGELISWGAAGEARLGQGRLTSATAAPGLVHLFRSLGLSVTAVTAGKQHSLALTQAGLYTWGCNKYGQLGLGLAPTSLASCASPRHVSGLQEVRVTHVSSGQFHSACLDSEGRVYTWGWGVHGQLGHGGCDDVLSPQLVTSLRRHRVIQVSCGYAHTVALTSKGHVFSWGCGLFGQLGSGHTGKHVKPVRVRVESVRGRVERITAGYFHNIALMETGEVVTWGANPQILRLEAQQRKKEKLLQKQLEESRRQAETCAEAGEAASEQERSMMSLHPQDSNTTPTDLHLSPSVLDTSMIGEKIVSVAAGSQHTALLTISGKLFTYGRNLEGQLGLGNRQSVKVPTQVTALGENRVTLLGAGADFTVAVTDSGTVFAWGSNAAGQLGRAPLEDPGSGAGPGTDNSRVLVMKTTKRIIRLQHGLQNSCDVPRPVQGLTKMRDEGIYAENGDTVHASVTAGKFYSEYSLHKKFPSIEPVFSSRSLLQFMHLTLELFHSELDGEELLRQCLVMENPLAAAKISLLCGKYLQAFDLAIQAVMRHGKQTDDLLLDTFLFYMSLKHAERRDKVGMFERLVCCWQDLGLSFTKLESFLLGTRDPTLLNIIIITLFCPQAGDKLSAHGDGPNKRTVTDIQLVDLFSPEFNLKIGDLFSKNASEMNPPLECAKEMSESEGFGSKLECIVSECLDRDILQ